MFYRFKAECRSIRDHWGCKRDGNREIKVSEMANQDHVSREKSIPNEIKSLKANQQWFRLKCCFTCVPRQSVLELSGTWRTKAQSLGVMLYYQVISWWSREGDFSLLLLVCLFGVFLLFCLFVFKSHFLLAQSPQWDRAAAYAERASESLECCIEHGKSSLMQFPHQNLQVLHDSQSHPGNK